MTDTVKAIVAKVTLAADVQVEGLHLPNGNFGIGVSQVAELFSFDTNQASRSIKPLLGKDFQFAKVYSELNSKQVNYLTLDQFKKVLLSLDRKGNKTAQGLNDVLLGLSLEQLFNDAFGIHYEKVERQAYLAERQIHRKNYHPHLTSWLKVDADGDSSKINWGKEINLFKAAAGLPIKPVDEYSVQELAELNLAEKAYHHGRKLGATHRESIAALD